MALERYCAAVRCRWDHFVELARRCVAEEDKRLHIKWSLWLTLGAHVFWPSLWAITLVFFIGLAKECWDEVYGTGFCMLDMASNLVGIVAGTALCTLVMSRTFS